VKLARLRRPKIACFLSYVEYIDLVQIQQYYEKQVMLKEVTFERGRVKEGS
jgi:hypothetical protein